MRASSVACGLVALLVWMAPVEARPRHRPYPSPTTHVRGTTLQVTQLIADAYTRSPTLAALITALDETDVIVHVEEMRHLPPGTDGGLLFTSVAGPVRYLRAQVLAGLSRNDRVSVIAHELQHALEVAEHAQVRDQQSFVALYHRIGDRPHRDRYDTPAARLAGRQVRKEMTE